MKDRRSGKGRLISTWVAILLLLATSIATVCLWLFVDKERYGFGLTLTLRILWGAWIVTLLSIILTRVTIFGWSFRRYFRWQADSPPPEQAPRPTRAPWTKGSKTSFTITVLLVALTGAAAVGTAVLWILEGVIGEFVFWLVSMIVWISWWVAVIATVLTRVAIFSAQRQRAREAEQTAAASSAKETTTSEQGNQP
jgi:hypothetical protein